MPISVKIGSFTFKTLRPQSGIERTDGRTIGEWLGGGIKNWGKTGTWHDGKESWYIGRDQLNLSSSSSSSPSVLFHAHKITQRDETDKRDNLG